MPDSSVFFVIWADLIFDFYNSDEWTSLSVIALREGVYLYI